MKRAILIIFAVIMGISLSAGFALLALFPTTTTTTTPTPEVNNSAAANAEKGRIGEWISKENLNQYGDSKDTVYAGGSPLFDESTSSPVDLYDYILSKHPDRPWNSL